MRYGPQGEPVCETYAERSLSQAELRLARGKYLRKLEANTESALAAIREGRIMELDEAAALVAAHKRPDSSVAAGTDRDKVNTETVVLVGPQGEKILATSEEGICPLCGQQFPENASADNPVPPGNTKVGIDPADDDGSNLDPNMYPNSDTTGGAVGGQVRENMFELLRSRGHKSKGDFWKELQNFFDVPDDADPDDPAYIDDEDLRCAIGTLFHDRRPVNVQKGMSAKTA